MTARSPNRARLLTQLADGKFHSGEALARQTGTSRSAVWKQLQALQQAGLGLERRRGRGYRLEHPIEPLDSEKIREAIPLTWRDRLRIACHDEVPSTNDLALTQESRERRPALVTAEVQRAGRGRRGRSWSGAYAAGISLSMGWHFPVVPSGLSGLAPAMAVVTAEALESRGVAPLALKWPNDIYLGEGKLAGLLIELRGPTEGPCDVTVGLGLNWALPADPPEGAAGLGGQPGRNQLIGVLAGSFCEGLERFAGQGFAAFQEAWNRRDRMAGKPVRIELPGAMQQGRSAGVDAEGAFLLEDVAGKIDRFQVGEVSLRPGHGSAA